VQTDLVFSRRGGKRPGAGRKPIGTRAGAPHVKRPTFKSRTPHVITLRVVKEVGQLRTWKAYRAFWKAASVVLKRDDFRIVDISLEDNHLHLTVEADNQRALSRGMQAFKISAARHLNREMGHTGTVFPERYHANPIRGRRQARDARCYVINNWRRHGKDRGVSWPVDPFSSGISFTGWRGLTKPFTPPAWYSPLPVSRPETWLLSEGIKYEDPIDCYEVPGKEARRRRRGIAE
jgi:REP element-mobilizing transposase RayT